MYKFRFFSIIFLNLDNSVNIETRLFKLCVLILDIIMEGTVSDFYFTKFMKYFDFFAIKKELRHK